jgi:hypothetical protein
MAAGKGGGKLFEAAIEAAGKAARDLHDELASKGSKAERKKWLRNRSDLPKTPSKNGPSSVTAATDPDTGITKAGTTFKDTQNAPYGGCAEDDALDLIDKARHEQGLPPKGRHEVYYSEAYHMDDATRPGEYVEEPIRKRNCKDVSDPRQYPGDVSWQHQRQLPDGTPDPSDKPSRWDDPTRRDIPGGVG